MTRRNDFATAERHFCRFLENHTPSKPEFKIGCQKKLFSKANEASFLARRIRSTHFFKHVMHVTHVAEDPGYLLT